MRSKRIKWISSFLVLALMVGMFAGCGQTSEKKEKITIAYQYGMGYAPVVIMKEQKLLEEKLPDVEIEWKVVGSGAAINEGIASGDIDVAMMGVAPFIIGWDKGIPYKVYSAMSCQPMGLMVNDENIQSLSDFTAEDKIAVVSYGSIQHIILCMGAEKEFGDMHALDSIIINMAHPEAYTTLLTKAEVKGHVATMPYYVMEMEEGMHEVMSTDEVFIEGSTLLIGVASTDFEENYPDMYAALVEATNEARTYIEEEPEGAAEILAKEEGIEPEKMLEYLQMDGVSYPEETVGMIQLAEFMKRAEFIEKVPEDISDLVFDNLKDSN